MTPEQFGRLKSELEESFEGARNAGRPMLLEGGLDWKSMSLSPRDMDFLEAQNLSGGTPPPARSRALRSSERSDGVNRQCQQETARRAADAAGHPLFLE